MRCMHATHMQQQQVDPLPLCPCIRMHVWLLRPAFRRRMRHGKRVSNLADSPPNLSKSRTRSDLHSPCAQGRSTPLAQSVTILLHAQCCNCMRGPQPAWIPGSILPSRDVAARSAAGWSACCPWLCTLLASWPALAFLHGASTAALVKAVSTCIRVARRHRFPPVLHPHLRAGTYVPEARCMAGCLHATTTAVMEPNQPPAGRSYNR